MIVTPVEHVIDIRRGGSPRAAGVHVSAVIAYIARQMGYLKSDDDGEVLGPAGFPVTAELRMAVGLAWEDWLAPSIPDMMYHIDNVQVDDIWMSPDGVRIDGDHVVLHEFKTTMKSMRGDDDMGRHWMWMAQIKAYCKAFDSRHAHLHVLWLCGDYNKPITPCYKVYGLEFTQREIDDNWGLILKHRDKVEPERGK